MTGSGKPPSSDASLDLLRTLLVARELRRHRESTGAAGSAIPAPPSRAASLDLVVPMVAGATALDPSSGDLLALSPDVPEAVLARGVEPAEIIEKWLARGETPDRGRAPGDQWNDHRRGVLGPFRPAGTGVEVLAGIALAFRMTGEARVGLLQCAIGEVTTGAWHEGLNLAAVRQAPLVVLVPAPSSTPVRGTRHTSLLEICDGYGIRGQTLSDPDPVEIRKGVHAAMERARAGEGVQLVEVLPAPSEEVIRRLVAVVEGGDRLANEIPRRIEALWDTVSRRPVPDPAEALHEVLAGQRVAPPWYRASRLPDLPPTEPLSASRRLELRSQSDH